ncbi:AMP-binding protein [Myxococcota bacterium]|nr:AMP-binding protein [Myxococcota bacterium]
MWRIPPIVEDGLDMARAGVRQELWRSLRPGGTAATALALAQGRRDLYLMLHKHARTRPDAVAVRDEERVLTWAQLQDEATAVAGGLAALGVRPRQRVALVLENRVEHVVAMAAALHLGAVPAPMSPHGGEQALVQRLSTGRFALAVVEAELVAAARRGLAPDRVLSMQGGWARLAAWAPLRAPLLRSRRARGEPDLVLFTSGTTGGSKGARIDMQRARLGTPFRLLTAFGLGRGDRLFTACPVYHAAPTLLTGLSMLAGAELVLARRFEPADFADQVRRLGITHAFAVPTMLGRLAASPSLDRLRGSSLRALISGGAALRPDLKTRILAGAGPILYDFYGATELGVVSVAGPADLAAHPGSVGRVLRGVEVRLVDPAGRPVPRGEAGELYVRSDLTSGYEGVDPDLPPGLEGWASAGDLARFEGDQLCIVGRVREVIVTGGVNVFPGEIEAVLGRHPAVAEVAVAGLPDADWGEAVTAFVVLAPGQALEPEALRAWARPLLGKAQLPKRVVLRQALPIGATGKVLRRALVEEALEGRGAAGAAAG